MSAGWKTWARRNIAAIKLLKQIESENRTATPEEEDVLAQFSGWGGLPQIFDEGNKEWAREYAGLKDLLTDEEYRSARASILNAFYTSAPVMRAIWSVVQAIGLKGGGFWNQR